MELQPQHIFYLFVLVVAIGIAWHNLWLDRKMYDRRMDEYINDSWKRKGK